MSIKYGSDQSGGVIFTQGETRYVYVSDEAIVPTSGYAGDMIEYTAIVKDSENEALPATFVMDLMFNAAAVIPGQVLNAVVYDPITFILTLSFSCPTGNIGANTVKLQWAEQII